MPTRLDAETDFEELTARIRTQSQQAPGSGTERVTIRSLEAVSSDSLATVLEAAESEHLEPGSLVFVLSRANAERLIEREFDIDDVAELEEVLGRRVRVEDEMPDDTILLLHPDAVDGEELVEPEAIACGVVGTDDTDD
ncbi:hypothetical protein CP556_11160 [Natrinema sp. CBA1119]|uniref:hypothetical protein n=1 Tax=unclassified Natrinema TaxID=2622230 RepID=UPI000BF5CEB2|nr:hypothetical protein [Natrinema sp. CBA1119]PGF16621.1 hypothetical protein CP556_11160 [Natrinema sp. CBA1119]